jgi:tRNA 2-thiocytidine biosynthesis protein TtcA
LRIAGFEYKALNRAIGRAIHDYDMIRDGDRILVGLSGGYDSLTLLWMLAERRKRVRVAFQLFAGYIDPGFGAAAEDVLPPFCERLEVPLRTEFTDDGVVSHGPSNRENPCFLCARRRRKRLFEIAAQLGCGTLALAHNKDDIIETLFLNICYSGEISTMRPAQELFNGRFRVIRPMAYAEEQLIRRCARNWRLPVISNPCPSAGRSRRAEIKAVLHQLYRSNPKIKGNIFHAMRQVKAEYLLK